MRHVTESCCLTDDLVNAIAGIPIPTQREGPRRRSEFGLGSTVMGTVVARSSAVCAVVLAAMTIIGSFHAPTANAEMKYGNYELRVTGRYDFHTWAWAVSRCRAADCIQINAIPMPVARAFEYSGNAQLKDGRYTLTVDVPDGLRCGNVYYGSTVPTRDVYSWDAATLQGTLTSSFSAGCDHSPGGVFTYPFTLARM